MRNASLDRSASLDAAACRAAVAPDVRAFVCGFTYLFVAGLHHSGTSLVHELVAARPGVSRLNLTKRQGEGQQAQRVWRPVGKRDADACATSLELGGEKVRLSKAAAETHCRDGLRKIVDDDDARASLAATWGPLWGGAGGLYRVEKDPDFGSAFLKLRLFPRGSAAVFVMRHPFATALSYRKHCGVATKCVAVWLEVWTACLRALRRDPAPHAVVRYEDVIHHADAVVDAVVGGATGRRLDYRAASDGAPPAVDAELCWPQVAARAAGACAAFPACVAALRDFAAPLVAPWYDVDPFFPRAAACGAAAARPALACSPAAPCDPPRSEALGPALAALRGPISGYG